MEYTTGKWEAEGTRSTFNKVFIRANGNMIATMSSGGAISDKEQNANAHLIASAPDMFQALVEMESYLENRHPESTVQVKIVKEALAKAIDK